MARVIDITPKLFTAPQETRARHQQAAHEAYQAWRETGDNRCYRQMIQHLKAMGGGNGNAAPAHS